ncbi:nicotinamidase-related amidase [Salsuginibacillus halophilus]|uniref:Nicotinamidase-related amidase n=1 Tax=Salsuginibacillus halophilus TaxID=517424 RepID=A0A2P8H3P8_9BACI|nr:isochorismatase family cysteine hydrolase [Salsuginibacillus halophilus]PSL40842.1 nicotinamidase-related amidase [Salsuginibacillus halophilus]
MNPATTALILIDMQKETNYELPELDGILAKTKTLADECRAQGIPVIYTRQINRADQIGLSKGEPITSDNKPYYYNDDSDAVEIFDEIAPKSGEIVIDKYRWSAFFETSLDLMLRGQGITDVIMAGFVTDGCLMTSTYDAYFRDYQVHMVHDLTATTSQGAHMAAHLMMGSWIYNITFYRAVEMGRYLRGESYQSFAPAGPDSLQFESDHLAQVFHETIGQNT